jgi:hypothetical protein
MIDLQQPGDYCVVRSAGAITALWARLPRTGAQVRLAAVGHGFVGRPEWEIAEHDDLTVSVNPSIDEGDGGYHGFLQRGVWTDG